jgi:hypothetical protein
MRQWMDQTDVRYVIAAFHLSSLTPTAGNLVFVRLRRQLEWSITSDSGTPVLAVSHFYHGILTSTSSKSFAPCRGSMPEHRVSRVRSLARRTSGSFRKSKGGITIYTVASFCQTTTKEICLRPYT